MIFTSNIIPSSSDTDDRHLNEFPEMHSNFKMAVNTKFFGYVLKTMIYPHANVSS